MVNVYAIVNRDIFGVPTITYPCQCAECCDWNKGGKGPRNVVHCQKKRQVQETYKTFQSPPEISPEILSRNDILPCVCGIWLFWNWLRRTSHPINVRVLENGQTIRKEMNWNAGRSSMVLLRSRLQEPRKSIHHQHRCELCPSALFLSRGNKGTTKQSN